MGLTVIEDSFCTGCLSLEDKKSEDQNMNKKQIGVGTPNTTKGTYQNLYIGLPCIVHWNTFQESGTFSLFDRETMQEKYPHNICLYV